MTVQQVDAVQQKYVLVGIRFDAPSRELLDWALVKVAEPGDRVLAIHVCRDHASQEQPLLDKYLEIYEGLCNVKKVDLAGQVLTGKSIRKTLVREAKKCAAAALLVGIDKRSAFGTCTATAKYCAKKLPCTTDVLAIQNGRIFFKRRSNSQLPGLYRDPRPSLRACRKESQSEFGESEADTEISCSEVNFSFQDSKSMATVCKDMKDERNGVSCGSMRSLSRLSFEYRGGGLEQKPGWPLLRRATIEIPRSQESSKISVVQWVMSLPDRTPYISPPCSSTPERLSNDSVLASDRNSYSQIDELSEQMKLLLRRKESELKWFDYDVLQKSTSQFSSENLIGKGGSNHVYKGILSDGNAVAVKVLESSQEARKDFALEIDIISSLNHKHIIPLKGISIQSGSLLSVYNFLPKGSLEENLHGKREKCELSWKVRFKIAVGVAEALNHLHNEVSQPIIHRDVKSSNILLTDEFEPQLSDFGFAIWGPAASAFVTEVNLVGTFGYLAPEYFMYGKVSDKVDVYAFGVVLLELLSGRKPINTEQSNGRASLVMRAKPMIENGDIKSLIDPNMVGDIDDAEMRRMVLAATLCLTQAARLRPNIGQVLKLLRGEIDLDRWESSRNTEVVDPENPEDKDDEVYPHSSVASHLGLAFLDVCDGSTSFSSSELRNSVSLEEYIKGRWSRSSSFD